MIARQSGDDLHMLFLKGDVESKQLVVLFDIIVALDLEIGNDLAEQRIEGLHEDFWLWDVSQLTDIHLPAVDELVLRSCNEEAKT